MSHTPAMLERVAKALYGPSWRNPLSIALNVDPRTIRRWTSEEFEIPPGIWPELKTLCSMQADKLREIAAKLA